MGTLWSIPGHSTPRLYLWWWWCSCSVVSNSCDPMGSRPPGSSVHEISQARILEWVVIGKNTGMGCHFLLPGIFPTWGSNPGLLHPGGSPALQADSLLTEPPGVTGERVLFPGRHPSGRHRAGAHSFRLFCSVLVTPVRRRGQLYSLT